MGQIRFSKTGRLRKLSVQRGYSLVTLDNDRGEAKNLSVHRAVLLAFVGPSDLHVNHINFNRADNRLENLEYVTQQDNIKKSREAGRYPPITNPTGFNGTAPRTGEYHSRAKLTEADVVEIRNSPLNSAELAAKFNVTREYINQLKRRKYWGHLK